MEELRRDLKLSFCNKRIFNDLFKLHEPSGDENCFILYPGKSLVNHAIEEKSRAAWSYVILGYNEREPETVVGKTFDLGSTKEFLEVLPSLNLDSNSVSNSIAELFAISRGLHSFVDLDHKTTKMLRVLVSGSKVMEALNSGGTNPISEEADRLVAVVLSQMLNIKEKFSIIVRFEPLKQDDEWLKITNYMAEKCTSCPCEVCSARYGFFIDSEKPCEAKKPELPKEEIPEDLCKRCFESPSASTSCNVPHPVFLAKDNGSSFGPDGSSHSFICGACDKSYTKSSSDRNAKLSDMPVTKGPKWCYSGKHTLTVLPDSDKRRKRNDVVVISGENMQDKINALDGRSDVRVLVLNTNGGGYDFDSGVEVAIDLPNLVEIQLQDVNLKKLHLTRELTPRVETIWMQNPTSQQEGKLDFKIEAPELKHFTCFFFSSEDYSWLQKMLDIATKLETFDSYKLWIPELTLASNALTSIRLHRADSLSSLKIWAPKLTDLNLQAAYSLEDLQFLQDHPLKAKLPEGFTFTEELVVNTANSSLSPEAFDAINAHPRVQEEAVDDHDEFEFGMGGTNPRAMLEQMMRMANQGVYFDN